MRIELFDEDFSRLRNLYSDAPQTLVTQEASDTSPLRYVQFEEAAVTAEVRLIERPDQKTFLVFRGTRSGVEGLVRAAAQGKNRPLYVNAQSGEVAAFQGLGFTSLTTSEAFSVSFERCLAQLSRVRMPGWCDIVEADAADVERLSDLDNRLRSDIAGTEDWNASVDWIKSEVAAPEIHRHEYLVARHLDSGEYIGLIRIWRDAGGPRVGMVGVVRQFRGSPVGPALVKQALTVASGWGSTEFVCETQTTNRYLYTRLKKFGRSKGQFTQMRLDP